MDNDRLILAQSLLDWSTHSKNQWLEADDSDIKELEALAAKRGLVLPSPDIALLKTYYAEIGVANRNHVLLEKSDVEKALPTLIGKQVNFNHEGAGQVCGYILDAKLEDKMIVVYACIFKSLFKDRFDEVKKKFEENDLTVSFEIYNVHPETKQSVMTMQEDGTKVISPIIFHGMGLLTYKPPACPRAKVTALLAEYIDEKIVTEANQIIEPILTNNEELVYASMALPCLMCEKCKKEGGQQMADEVKIDEIKSEEVKIDEAKVLKEPIDPNLFVKEDGSLDDEKLEAALPKEVTARVRELMKEGKKPAEAVKQAWEEYNKGKEKAEEEQAAWKCSKCGYSEMAPRPLDKCPECGQPMADLPMGPEKNEGGQTATPSIENTVAEVAPVEVPESEEAETPREGNQNWTCPDCAFTFPLLAGINEPQYCPRCGKCYMAEVDETPVMCEMNAEAELMNEEEVHNDESIDLETSKKLEYKSRQNLPDSDFAVVVKKGDQKVRMYPILDEAHVRNALARLGQAKPRETLKRLGVSLEAVKRKILARAKKLGMTDLVERYKETSSIEDEAILNLTTKIAELNTAIENKTKEFDVVKAEVEALKKDKEIEVTAIKQELETKTQEIASLKTDLENTNPVLSVGSITIATDEEIKKRQEKVDELAFGKKKR
jgi:rubrerythrin